MEAVIRPEVFVDCNGDDSIRARVCFAGRGKIASITGFQLIESPEGGAVGLNFSSMNTTATGGSGLSSALAVTLVR